MCINGSFVSGSIFKELGQSSRVVFAAGSRLGLAWGFPQTLPLDVEGKSVDMRRTLALPLSERFFAGEIRPFVAMLSIDWERRAEPLAARLIRMGFPKAAMQ